MGLVHKNPVNTQLLKGNDIILSALVIELFQSLLNAFPAALQLLHGKIVAVVALQLPNAVQDLLLLLLQNELLPLLGHGDLFKLTVADDDGIVVAGGDPGAEPFSVFGFKILFGGNQNIGGGIKLQVFCGPLLGQMIWHHKQAFLTQPQPLALLGCCHHLERLPCPHRVGEQCVSTIENMGDGIHLMRPQGDFRVDPYKIQMASVIFPWANAVEFLIVKHGQPLPAIGVCPDPIRKFLFDLLLLSLGNGGLLRVEDSHLFTGVIIFIVENPYIPQIQGFLNDFVGVDAFRTKGVLGADIPSVQTFSVYIPLAGVGAVIYLDVPPLVVRRPQKLKGKIPHDLGWQPGSTQPDRNLTGRQVNGLHRFQGLYIDGIPFICLGKRPGGAQLFPDIAGKVFIRRQIFMGNILISVMLWVQENHAFQIRENFFLALVGQLHHVGHIYFCFFSQ